MEPTVARPKAEGETAQEDDGTSAGQTEEGPFTAEKLRAALAIQSPRIVKELYEIIQRRIAYESGRQQRLDAKATSLLTASGVSVTLAFNFFGVLASKDGGTAYHAYFNLILLAFGVAIGCGLAAAWFAVDALKIRKGYATAEDEHIFDASNLKKADSLKPEGADENEGLVDEWRLMEYQKGLIEHYWEIAEQHSKTHEEKAQTIRSGQKAFVFFLGSILVVCALAGVAVYSHHRNGQAAARPASSAESPAEGTPRRPPGQQLPGSQAATIDASTESAEEGLSDVAKPPPDPPRPARPPKPIHEARDPEVFPFSREPPPNAIPLSERPEKPKPPPPTAPKKK